MNDQLADSLRERKKRLTRDALHTTARRRVIADGLTAVTIDEICAEVGVSSRTFFNYFPSKAAAAVGLPDLTITDERRDEYVAAHGNPVHDLCDLLADVIGESGGRVSDKSTIHDLISMRPEIYPEVFTWLHDVRKRFFEVAALRLPQSSAKFAVALVMAALNDSMESPQSTGDDVGARLWASVTRMGELVTAENDALLESPVLR